MPSASTAERMRSKVTASSKTNEKSRSTAGNFEMRSYFGSRSECLYRRSSSTSAMKTSWRSLRAAAIVGMKLPEARHGFAVEHGARRAPGMEVRRRHRVEVQGLVLKRREQIFDVALHVEEGVRLGRAMNVGRNQIAGRGEGQRAMLLVALAGLGEDLSRFEQAHIVVATVQVVANHVRAGRAAASCACSPLLRSADWPAAAARRC